MPETTQQPEASVCLKREVAAVTMEVGKEACRSCYSHYASHYGCGGHTQPNLKVAGIRWLLAKCLVIERSIPGVAQDGKKVKCGVHVKQTPGY